MTPKLEILMAAVRTRAFSGISNFQKDLEYVLARETQQAVDVETHRGISIERAFRPLPIATRISMATVLAVTYHQIYRYSP